MPPLFKNPKLLILIGGGILLLLVVLLLVLSQQRSGVPTNTQTPGQPSQNQPGSGSSGTNPADSNPDPGTANVNVRPDGLPQGVFAKVGDEYLYEADLNYELAYYPTSNDGTAEDILTKKLIDDSIILQGAAEEGLIKLDNTIYNSPDKDYQKRIDTVMDLKEKLDQKATVLEGSVIAIWFHNMQPGSVGYEKGKQIASTEISRLQKAVKDGSITMLQAGTQLKNNAQLAQVDPSYRANAYFEFAVSDNQKITYSPTIDQQIYQLNKGDVSAVLTGKDRDPETNAMIDAVYMVAQVTDRGTSNVTSYENWLVEKRKTYEVTRY